MHLLFRGAKLRQISPSAYIKSVSEGKNPMSEEIFGVKGEVRQASNLRLDGE